VRQAFQKVETEKRCCSCSDRNGVPHRTAHGHDRELEGVDENDLGAREDITLVSALEGDASVKASESTG
jgi:hypothetical protein